MNNYETVFIVTPVLSDAQVQEVADKFQGVITENGGQIVNKESWGLRKLAYPIQKKTTGFYFLVEFTGEGSLVNTLETQYRRDERVIRFLTFKQMCIRDSLACFHNTKEFSSKILNLMRTTKS